VAVQFVDLVLRGAHGLHPTGKLILVVLAEHANADSGGVAWPSVETIARLVNLSDRMVQLHLRDLCHEGWIAVDGDMRGGYRNTVRYKLNVHRLREARKGEAHFTEKGAADFTVRARQTVKSGAGKGEICMAKTAKPASPEPSSNLEEPARQAGKTQGGEPENNTSRGATVKNANQLRIEELARRLAERKRLH